MCLTLRHETSSISYCILVDGFKMVKRNRNLTTREARLEESFLQKEELGLVREVRLRAPWLKAKSELLGAWKRTKEKGERARPPGSSQG